MSFILDALRKAEARRGSPTPVAVPPMPAQAAAARHRRPVVPWPVVAIGIGTALLAGAYAWQRSASTGDTVRVDDAVPEPAAVVAAPLPDVRDAVPARSQRDRGVRPLDREATNGRPRLATAPPADDPAGKPVGGTVTYAEGALDADDGAVRSTQRTGRAGTVTVVGGQPKVEDGAAAGTAPRRGTVTVADEPLDDTMVVPSAAMDTTGTATRADSRPAGEPASTVSPRDSTRNTAPEPEPVVQAPAPQRADPSLATYSDVALTGADIPSLHLDIHVYSDDPGSRFVFVNMRKYREGDRVDDGLHVERITVDGAVLVHRGRRFLLPRT